MADIPSELAKFLSVPGAVGAVVDAIFAAHLLTSGCYTDRKNPSVRVLCDGLEALAGLAHNLDLASQILGTRGSDHNVLELAQSIVADAQWPENDSTGKRSAELCALLFVSSMSRAPDPQSIEACKVGLISAVDQRMVEGMVREH